MPSDLQTATIALIIQAALTGLQFATFLLCLRFLIFSDRDWTPRKSINWYLLVVTVLLIAFSITILGLTLQSALFYVKNGNDLLPTGTVSVRNIYPFRAIAFFIYLLQSGDVLNCAVVIAMDIALVREAQL